MRRASYVNGAELLSAVPWAPLAAGSWLIAAGVRKGSVLGGCLAAAGGAMLYRTVVRPAPSNRDRRPSFARGVKIRKSIFVNSSPNECYRFWRNLENLSGVMDQLDSVRALSKTRSRWTAKSIGGMSIEWDSEIVRDEPGRILGWRSMPGSPLHTAGSVRFEPESSGTLVTVTLKYDPPGGEIGAAVAELMGGSPSRQIERALVRFRKIVEKREVNGRPATAPSSDPVDRSSFESFPASDPPSWVPTA